MKHIITIVLNEDDPGYCFSKEPETAPFSIMLGLNKEPQDMHFHFGPGAENMSDLTQKVNFLLNKNNV